MKMRPNKKKALESILYLINEAQDRALTLTQYDIVKSIFVADYQHMASFGRPITFDNYTAMKNGPVPEFVYDLLKPNYAGWPMFGYESAPWTTAPAPKISPLAVRYYGAHRAPNLRALSQSDVQELGQALDFVSTLGFSKVRDFTHNNPAYKEAWENRGTQKAKRMDFQKTFQGISDDDYSELLAVANNR